MKNIICVTNRKLCNEPFITRIEKIAAQKPRMIILREKDLSPTEYLSLAKQVFEICKQYEVQFCINSHLEAAKILNVPAVHLPLSMAQNSCLKDSCFTQIGISVHSVKDAISAKNAGATYLIAGHIFATDCKLGLPGRGLEFLFDVVKSVDIPVYAIGGIDANNIDRVINTGAAGACMMSSLMKCNDFT